MKETVPISFDSEQHELLLVRLDAATAAINELERELLEAQRLSAAWSGTSKETFDASQAEWTESIENLRSSVSRARAGASGAGERLLAAERAATDLWSM
jgi:uncharacterized protein YukE